MLEGTSWAGQDSPASCWLADSLPPHSSPLGVQAGLEFNYAGDFAGGSTRMRAAGLVAL